MTIRWGLLGCGDIARKRVTAAIKEAPDSQLVSACRRNESKLAEFCREFQVAKAFTDEAELIADSDIDAVYIATPVHLHWPQTQAAAKAGKHVLVEKPMAMSTAECDQMIKVCQDAGVQLGVAYYRRFYPIVLRMKEILASGEIGTPMSISAVTATSLDMKPGDDGYWRVIDAEGGGGALMDVGSHRLNLFLDFFGEVRDVAAFCDILAGTYEGEDCASLLLRFHSGAHGNLQCFFSTPVNADEFVITGSKGRLIASPLNGDKLVIDLGQEQREETHPAPENLHGPLLADFVRACADNRSPVVDGIEGRKTNEVMERAYQAKNA